MAKENEAYNIVSYAQSFFKTMSESPLNELDFAIFAKLSYFNCDAFLNNFKDSILIKDLYDLSKIDVFLKRISYKDEDLQLINAICGNPRFREIKMKNFLSNTDLENSEQFAAISFELEDRDVVIAYRGTDASLTGWKEDFDMAYLSPVPAQKSAEKYINKVGVKAKKNIYVCGHSKGGNLAVYAYLSSKKKIRKKILGVYSLDGPGFDNKIKQQLKYGYYKRLIHKYIPTQSVIGLIFDDGTDCVVVKSEESLLSQHNYYNWHVSLQSLCFIREPELSKNISKTVKAINTWIATCNEEDRALVVDTLYGIVVDAGFHNIKELLTSKFKSFLTLRKEYKTIDDDTRVKVSALLKQLGGLIYSNYFKKDNGKDLEKEVLALGKDLDDIKE